MRSKQAKASRGFTLIEALVALAVIAAVLGAIGSAIATTVRGARAIDERLALASTVQALLATLPPRAALQAGRSSGQSNGFLWRIDVTAMPSPTEARWQPMAVELRVEKPGGASAMLKTVRLVAP